jgi:hypothetical protein
MGKGALWSSLSLVESGKYKFHAKIVDALQVRCELVNMEVKEEGNTISRVDAPASAQSKKT